MIASRVAATTLRTAVCRTQATSPPARHKTVRSFTTPTSQQHVRRESQDRMLQTSLASAAALSASLSFLMMDDWSTNETKCDMDHRVNMMMPDDGPQLSFAHLEEESLSAAHLVKDWLDFVVKGRQQRRFKEKVEPASQHHEKPAEVVAPISDDRWLSLQDVDLQNLTMEQAQHYIDALQTGKAKFDMSSLMQLTEAAVERLQQDKTLVDLKGRNKDITVVGDLHGDLPCLHSVLEMVGDLSDGVLVVCGDYVDRGSNSLEVLATLLLLKLAYPDNVFLLRGNHEDAHISSVYGFQQEVESKYGKEQTQSLWGELSRVFASLPLSAVTDTAMIVHGGLPSADFKLADLEKISAERRSRITTTVNAVTVEEKMVEALLWSDPSYEPGVTPNERRGGYGVMFGPDVVRDFLNRHGLQYIIRGHETPEHGAHLLDCGGDMGVITVCSVAEYPNGEGTNGAAVIHIPAGSGKQCYPLQFR